MRLGRPFERGLGLDGSVSQSWGGPVYPAEAKPLAEVRIGAQGVRYWSRYVAKRARMDAKESIRSEAPRTRSRHASVIMPLYRAWVSTGLSRKTFPSDLSLGS